MAECLSSTSCVAVDLTPFACALHSNADDLVPAYYALGVTQFVLNAHYPLTIPLSKKLHEKLRLKTRRFKRLYLTLKRRRNFADET